MADARLMVVEDETLIALDLQHTLIGLGYDVPEPAASGSKALEQAAAEQPELALMDIRIDGPMDGIDTARELRERFGIPVIFLTAFADEQILRRAQEVQPLGYLIKPYKKPELHNIIEIALYRHRAEREKEREDALGLLQHRTREAVWRMRRAEDIDNVVNGLLQELEGLGIRYAHCGVNLIDGSVDPPLVRFPDGRGGWEPPVARTAGRVIDFWRRGEPVYRPDLEKDDPYNERERIAEVWGEPVRSVLDLPFSHGTLALNSPEPAAFGEAALNSLQQVADILSEAFTRIDDMRTLEERNNELRDEIEEHRQTTEELAQQTAELTTANHEMAQLNQELAMRVHLDAISRGEIGLAEGLRLLVGELMVYLGANSIEIYTVDWLEMEIELVAHRNHGRDELNPDIRYAIGEGLSGWIAEHGETIRIGRPEDDPRSISCAGIVTSFLGVPVLVEEEAACVIAVGRFDAVMEAFNERDEARLLEVAANLAACIGNMRVQEGRQEAEAALRESEERLFTVIESLDEGLMLTDVGDTVLYLNTRLSEMTGYPLEEMLGQHAYELLVPEAEWAKVQERTKSRIEGRADRYEMELLRQDGSRFWADITATPYRNALGEVVGTLAAITDITVRKELEGQLVQSQKMEAVGELAAGVAHNFNNALMGVMGNIDLVRFNLEGTDQQELVGGYLADAAAASRDAAELVRELMVFSRKADFERPPVDVKPIVREVVEFCRVTFDRKIEVIETNAERMPIVLGNRAQIKQILLNLCINARDALASMSMDGFEPRIELVVNSVAMTGGGGNPDASPGRYICLSVADNGPGMDEDTRRRVFEPFFTTKEVGHGTGLGLATVYGIARQHNGWVELDSEPGAGSRFAIYLPEARDAQPDQPPEDEGGMIRGDEAVLIIDDEERVRNTVAAVLKRCGYTVRVSSDGIEGLEVFREQEVDLVLLDVSMPKMSGQEVLAELMAINAQARVVVFSGLDTDRAEFPGAWGFMQKPLRPAVIARTVREVLDA